MPNKRIQKKQWKALKQCCLCGETLPAFPGSYVIGSTGRAVCQNCLSRSHDIMKVTKETSYKKREEKTKNSFSFLRPSSAEILSPKQMIAKLNEAIIGQEQAKKAVATTFWKQQMRNSGMMNVPNTCLMLYGPTGCGKTALVSEAAKAVDLPFLAVDCTTLTETGYRGKDAISIGDDLCELFGENRAPYSVVFFDEVDKLAATQDNESRAAFSRGTQYSLLRMIEGSRLKTEKHDISTNKMLFIFGGAFSGMRKQEKRLEKHIGFDRAREDQPEEARNEFSISDFVAFGMEPELMGRISRCVPLYPLGEAEMRRILLESKLSQLRYYRSFFRNMGRVLPMEEEEITSIIHEALERGTGARGLNALVEEWVEPKLMAFAEEWSRECV